MSIKEWLKPGVKVKRWLFFGIFGMIFTTKYFIYF